jgi:hypothetical protein
MFGMLDYRAHKFAFRLDGAEFNPARLFCLAKPGLAGFALGLSSR